MVGPLRKRRERRLAEADALRSGRKLLDEDVTVFGEELTALHEATPTTALDADTSLDYQRALDLYESAKLGLDEAADTAALSSVESSLVDGRFHLACVVARRDGVDLPVRRDSCFFNSQHGPAIADVPWTPSAGVERSVGVCRRDLERLTVGEPPDIRVVRVGDRYVPWHEAGGAAVLLGNRAHVMGTTTPLTDASVAEANIRAGTSGANGSGGFV